MEYTGNGNLPDDWNEAAFEAYWGYEDGEDNEEDWEDDDDYAEWE